MITQQFLIELESAVLRSYARAHRKIGSFSVGSDIVQGMNYTENFMNEFRNGLAERRSVIEEQIRMGGHAKDYAKLSDKVFSMVENRVKANLNSTILQKKAADDKVVRKVIDNLKKDVRDLFYEGYLAKRG